MAYALVLETSFCGFESHLAYFVRVWNPFSPAIGTIILNLARVYEL